MGRTNPAPFGAQRDQDLKRKTDALWALESKKDAPMSRFAATTQLCYCHHRPTQASVAAGDS